MEYDTGAHLRQGKKHSAQPLIVDRNEIEQFMDLIFRHALDMVDDQDESFLSMRAFRERGASGEKPAKIEGVRVIAGDRDRLVDALERFATKCANNPEPWVCAPPVCLFNDSWRAREADLAYGPAIAVEMDKGDIGAQRRCLEDCLGPATVVVASGGTYVHPETGEVHDKLHLYWRLKHPTIDTDEHGRLKYARGLACDAIGADSTGKSVSHPYRLPGSWHRKGEPRLCRVVNSRPEAEVGLEWAIEQLEALPKVQKASTANGAGGGNSLSTGRASVAELIAQIIRGENYHDAILRLANHYADQGLPEHSIVENIQGLMLGSDAPRDGRFWARFDEIQRCVRDAVAFSRGRFGERRDAAEEFEAFDIDDGQTDGHEAGQNLPQQGNAQHGQQQGARQQQGNAQRGQQQGTGQSAGRSQIRTMPGSFAHNVDEAERVLAASTLADPLRGVFQRGGVLARPIRLRAVTVAEGVRRAKGSLTISHPKASWVQVRLGQVADWLRLDKWQQWVFCNPPAAVAKAVAELGTWEHLPNLTGIIEAPTLRPDGTVLEVPGYDQASGLYFDPGDTVFPKIPDKPTRADAEAALLLLKDVIKGFPFVDQTSRSVALAMLMTPLVRNGLRAAPLFAISAPKMSSGKTLLSSVCSYIATGRTGAVMPQAESAEEEKKRLLALLMQGAAVSVIDNVERPIRSDALCTVLTEERYTDRLLGASANVTVPTATTWIATGNNIKIAGDLSSRALLCCLNPREERPEEREFEVDLHEYVPRHRGELAVAALTIVRAFVTAGCPKQGVRPFGRFETWSRIVREALVWLGEADPCASREAIEAFDPVREQLRALLHAWRDLFGDRAVTVAEAFEESERVELEPQGQTDEQKRARLHVKEQRTALKEAFALFEDNARRVGKFIAKHEERIEGGLYFKRDENLFRRATRWCVKVVV